MTKINANGTYGWTKKIGGASYDIGCSTVTDNSGNVYITGYFSGTVNFGTDFGVSDNITYAGNYEVFVTKLYQ